MTGILVLPIGDIDPDILGSISRVLEEVFHCAVRVGGQLGIDQSSYNPLRKQYYSSMILRATRSFVQGDFERVLGVTGVDLYVPELNFIFGEADPAARVTIISLARLRQEWYGLHPDRRDSA